MNVYIKWIQIKRMLFSLQSRKLIKNDILPAEIIINFMHSICSESKQFSYPRKYQQKLSDCTNGLTTF